MDVRRGTLTAAAQYVLEVRDQAAGIEGRWRLSANSSFGRGRQRRPGRCSSTVDAARRIRSGSTGWCRRWASSKPSTASKPVAMSDSCVVSSGRRSRCAASRGRAPVRRSHDAAPLGAAGVEAGMLFVRSLNGGASRSPEALERRGHRTRRRGAHRNLAPARKRQVTVCYLGEVAQSRDGLLRKRAHTRRRANDCAAYLAEAPLGHRPVRQAVAPDRGNLGRVGREARSGSVSRGRATNSSRARPHVRRIQRGPTTASVLLDVAFRLRPPEAVLDHVSGVGVPDLSRRRRH